jgi:predicted sulfurtransferase
VSGEASPTPWGDALLHSPVPAARCRQSDTNKMVFRNMDAKIKKEIVKLFVTTDHKRHYEGYVKPTQNL